MEVISANPEFRYIAQPFAAYAGNGKSGHTVFNVDYGLYLDPSSRELEHIYEFISGLLRGSKVLRAPWKVWERGFWQAKTRTVLKILQAKPLMTWMESSFDLQVLYLLRHPIAQAASVVKAGWPAMNRAFLEHPTFPKRHLTPRQRQHCESVAAKGSQLEQHVLSWCLDNLLPLRELATGKDSWLVLTYEDCIAQPEQVIGLLGQTLKVDNPRFMQRQFAKASGTARITNQRNARVFREAQLTKWTRQFSAAEITAAFDILCVLGIDAYNESSPMATDAYRLSSQVKID